MKREYFTVCRLFPLYRINSHEIGWIGFRNHYYLILSVFSAVGNCDMWEREISVQTGACMLGKCRIRAIVFSLAILVLGGISGIRASVPEEISAHFASLDTALRELSEAREMRVRNISEANGPLEQYMDRYPEVIAVLRINSNGKVVNEIVRKGRPGKKFRDVSSQSWFSTVSALEPYYGYLETRGEKMYLFWSRPIKVESGSDYRSGGAVVAKIRLNEALNSVRDKVESAFRILVENRAQYSHDWEKGANYEEQSLRIRGLPETTLQYVPSQRPAAASEAPVTRDEEIAGDVAETEKGAADAAAQKGGNAPEGRDSKGFAGLFPLLVGLIALVALIVLLVWYMTKRRKDEMIRRIEEDQRSAGGSESFEYSKTVVIPKVEMNKAMTTGEQSQAPHSASVQPQNRSAHAAMPQPAQNQTPRGGGYMTQATTNQGGNPVNSDQELERILAQRTEQIQREVYDRTRKAFVDHMRHYSTAIERQMDALARVSSQAQGYEAEELNRIRFELSRIRDAMEGKPQQ